MLRLTKKTLNNCDELDTGPPAVIAWPGRVRAEHAAHAPLLNGESKWYAVVTAPRHEKKASAHLEGLGIDAFLPTYSSVRTWKNRQRQTIIAPLFPTYLFARITLSERIKVLSSPGVRTIVSNGREPLPVEACEVEALRRTVENLNVEPYHGLLIGQRVRINRGPLAGVEGHLIRHNNAVRVVLTVELIRQHAAVEVDISNLTPVEV